MARKIENIDGYFSVRTSTLPSDKPMGMDVFVNVDGKPVRYCVAGDTLEVGRAKRLTEFKLSKVFIRAEDETRYRVFLDQILNEAETNSKLKLEERTDKIKGGAESAMQDVVEKPEDKMVYTTSIKEFERFGRFLQHCDGSIPELLKTAGKTTNDYVSHGVQVAALSLLMAQKLDLAKDAKKRNSLMTACFLHDIACEKWELPRIEEKDMDPATKAQWLKHASEGTRFFGDKDWVDPQVIKIILQHEEIPNGSGFPKGLREKDLDPLSIVVSLANRFDRYLWRHKGDKEAAAKEFTIETLGLYDMKYMDALKQGLLQHK